MFDGIITSWEKGRNSPEHRQRVEISRSMTSRKPRRNELRTSLAETMSMLLESNEALGVDI